MNIYVLFGEQKLNKRIANSNLYYFHEGKLIVIILILYVDNLLIIGNHVMKIEWLEK
jgi:hypothetical protein